MLLTNFHTPARTTHVRLRAPDGDYLHQSGTGTTRSLTWAWSGTRRQANTLREQTEIRGDDWPFLVVEPEDVE